jgi:CRP-like cAMP-binding protein
MVFFELFAHNPTIIHVPAGGVLFSENDDGHMMYVLTAGTAEVIVNNRVVETLTHGSIVGEMGLVSPGPRSAGVIALTNCEFVEVDEKRFQFLVQQTPFFATQVMRVMAERLRKLNQLIAPIEDI